VKDFGAVGDGVADDTAAIQAALTNAPNYSAINFSGGRYKTTAALIMPAESIGIVINGNGSTIECNHNGDGLVLNSTNQNYSRHKVYDLYLKGPNISYPNNSGELIGTSTGSGLKIGPNDTTNTCTAYMCSFVNCRFENFLYGVYMQNSLMCQFMGGGAFFNQYGVYIDGGQTNANNFSGFTIRENRLQGVKSSGRTGGSLSNATHNTFYGCEIETNIPYNLATGGYPAAFDSTGVGSGIMLSNTYGFVFDGCYMENHNYSVWMDASSDQNQFINMRFAPGGVADVRVAGVAIKGTGANNNVFQSCRMICLNATTANVLMDNAGQLNNQFLECQGFNFIPASLTGTPYVRNNGAYIGGGTADGAIAAPSFGKVDVFYSATDGRGVLSATTGSCTLNASGIAEAKIGSGAGLTGPITITNFTNAKPYAFLAVNVTQGTYAVTIQSGTMGTGALVICKGAVNAVMGNGNLMLFWVNSIGQIIEVGRNF
jgi:hypothetical protein